MFNKLIFVEHPMFDRHSPIAHSAYHDLVASLRDEAIAEIRGTPTRVERGRRTYWYDSYRVGSDVKKTYIGEDSEALRARMQRIGALREGRENRRRNRARLVRLLRAEGFLGIDAATGSLLHALASAGVFRLGGTVVGTQAFRLYEGELGVRFSFDQTAQTSDIDIASFERLSIALEDTVSSPLDNVLRDFSFEPAPALDPGKAWRWRQTRNETLVEFLTPSFTEDEPLRPLPALGVHAQSLHHLNYLLAEPILAAVTYRDGVLIQIPRPERFAIHKLIVADRRLDGPDSLKALKDRLQAEFLITVLALDRPDDVQEALEDALSRGKRWRERIKKSINKSPSLQARLGPLT
ncbi:MULTISPECIES: GSU2403 family nucleotidyltransferase fold protein [unclassified Mesorhizobium]|uniref:nucleotidyltransferase family protein n=1 Tax=unclassified Mesorhizobium TaxID=325217 RepID=UPI001FDF4016|nr:MULTISPECIES: GSU2403 family nucleotidyltransferase fold protein [unclassified Mesorhizobium]